MAHQNYRNNTGRQEIIAAVQGFDGTAMGTGTVFAAFDLPENAIIVGGQINVLGAFDVGITATLDIDGDTLLSAIDMTALADTDITKPNKKYATPVQGTVTFSGAVTQGEAYITIEYVEEGRAAFSQG